MYQHFPCITRVPGHSLQLGNLFPANTAMGTWGWEGLSTVLRSRSERVGWFRAHAPGYSPCQLPPRGRTGGHSPAFPRAEQRPGDEKGREHSSRTPGKLGLFMHMNTGTDIALGVAARARVSSASPRAPNGGASLTHFPLFSGPPLAYQPAATQPLRSNTAAEGRRSWAGEGKAGLEPSSLEPGSDLSARSPCRSPTRNTLPLPWPKES